MKKILTVLILGICFMITGCKDKHPVLENRMINGQLLVYNANRNKPYSGGYSVTEYKNNVSVVTEEGYYKKGLQDGTCYIYTDSGVLYLKSTYKNGHKLGYKQYYYNSDAIDEIVKFNNLETYRESYYTNRQLKSKGTYYDRKEPNTFEYEAKIGAYEEYYENGQLKIKETYNEKGEQLEFLEYSENGVLKK